MDRGRGNGWFVLLIVLGLAAAGGAVWLHRQRALQELIRNERTAVTALTAIAYAEADFRANDRDGNGVNDFWTGDVAGLYTVTGKDGAELRLIGRTLADADALAVRPAAATPLSMHGYLFMALDADDSNPDAVERIYRQDTGGKPPAGKVHHPSAFGFCAYPEQWGVTGRFIYIINENNTIFRRVAPGDPPKTWPSDQDLARNWTKTNW